MRRIALGEKAFVELLILLLAILVVLSIAGVAAGRWILAPLEPRMEGGRTGTQFTLVDLLCLFVVLEIPLAWVGAAAAMPDDPRPWILGGFLAVYFGLVWWAGVRKLSQAGIRNPWHRGGFLVLVFPGTILGLILAVAIAVVAVALLFPPSSSGWAMLLVAIDLGLGFCLYAFGRFTRRMAAAAAAPRTGNEDADQEE
ncbi:MAG: hypothetical protein ABFD16_15980 [Thermoguttaceae bacterium]